MHVSVHQHFGFWTLLLEDAFDSIVILHLTQVYHTCCNKVAMVNVFQYCDGYHHGICTIKSFFLTIN